MPNTSDAAHDKPLPAAASTWAITVGANKDLNYGQMHDIIHRDIAIGNDYRKERIKLLITLATGVFALTVTFHKDLLTNTGFYLVLAGWAMMIISLGAGIVHFQQWENFYLEHRARGNAVWRYYVATAAAAAAVSSDVALAAATEERKARIAFHKAGEQIAELQRSYRKWNVIQCATLVVGMILIALYAAVTGHAALEKARQELVKSTRQGAEVLSPVPGASAQKSAMPSAAASGPNTQGSAVQQPAARWQASPAPTK